MVDRPFDTGLKTEPRILPFKPKRSIEDRLQRGGWILIGWWSLTGPDFFELFAYWMPETGPRWVYYCFALQDDEIDTSGPDYRLTRASARRALGEAPRKAVLLAPHLLEDGPDRRAAYLRKIKCGRPHSAAATGAQI